MYHKLTKPTFAFIAAIVASIFIATAIVLPVNAETSPTADAAVSTKLSEAERKKCRADYGGKNYNLDKKADKAAFEKFKKTKCYEGNKGNCSVSITKSAVDEDGKRVQRAAVSCPLNPKKDDKKKNNDGESVTDPALTAGGCTGSGCEFIDAYINPFIKFLSAAVGVAAVIAIIIGAIQVSTSAGDPQKSASGKNHIRNALIGIVAYVILFLVLNWVIPGGIS